MPCNSDYMQQNSYEAYLQETAVLCDFVLQRLHETVPDYVKLAKEEYYCKEERTVPLLCQLINGMDEEQKESILYNGRNPWSRALADWWEKHQNADRERKANDQQRLKDSELIESARKKLTPEEARALGLQED